jgi:hypothetical protein
VLIFLTRPRSTQVSFPFCDTKMQNAAHQPKKGFSPGKPRDSFVPSLRVASVEGGDRNLEKCAVMIGKIIISVFLGARHFHFLRAAKGSFIASGMCERDASAWPTAAFSCRRARARSRERGALNGGRWMEI